MKSELSEQLQRALGSAYLIELALGGGGMSRVFVAEERSLGRRVVVKVLPPEVSSDRTRRSSRRASRRGLLAAGSTRASRRQSRRS